MNAIESYIRSNPQATDEQVLAAVNAPVLVKVSLATLAVWLTTNGRMARFRAATNNEQYPEPLRIGIADLLDAIHNPRLENVDLTNGEIAGRWQQLIGAAAQLGLLSDDEAAQLLAMGYAVKTPATLADVAAARIGLAKAVLHNRWKAIFSAGQALIDNSETVPTEADLRNVEA